MSDLATTAGGAVGDRPAPTPGTPDLDRFFRPRAVAVIGASDSPGSQAAMNYRQIRAWAAATQVPLFPVNPNREEVDGERCYHSILDAPGEVDVAVILVAQVEAALEEVGRKGATFAVVFGAGFAESGDAQRQAALVGLARSHGVRLLGPNTTLNAFQTFRDDLPGKRIALITQSGHQGRPLYQAQQMGIAVSHWAPTGNEADLESADFVRYFADQPEVGAIAAYIEGFKDGRALIAAADHAARQGVPIVVVKVGRTEVGRSWAQSHSGHLAGSDAVTSALFRQYGIVRVDTLDELLDTSMLLARAQPPQGDGVCVYSISGGTSAHIADLATAWGLRLPELAPATQDRLHEWIPEFLRVSNPVDSGGIATADERGRWILETILADPNVAVLVVPIVGSFSPISEKFAQDIVDVAATSDKPVCVVWGSPVADEEAYRDILLGSQVPVFRSARNCLMAVKAYLDTHAFHAGYVSPFGASPPVSVHAHARRLLRTGSLSEHTSKQLIAEFGVPVTRDVLCASADDAVTAADALGYPVVMKVSSPTLAHKSDLGLVRVGVATADEVRATFDELTARPGNAASEADIEGVLVCELVRGGVETIIGVVQDELFGPVVLFGMGGVAVEVYRDVTFRVPPFTRDEARRMVEEVRGLPLLLGARGQPPADLDALVDAILAVQSLAVELGDDLAELDINPLVALPDRVVALDALAVGR